MAPRFRGRTGYVELFAGKVKSAPAKTALGLADALPPLRPIWPRRRAQRHEGNDPAILINHFSS
ncbi:MAG: hypothetical protein CR217_02045 [Beijerinckiaceae bacterium]|nr:MAG: hypothetical protein CR217_02045 [Beijerinckiaceae bacterium]